MPTESNPFKDARLFWNVRAGQTHRALATLITDAFREQLRPGDPESVRNTEDMAVGRVVALWMAAAVADPEWAERFVTWTVDADEKAAQDAIEQIRAVMTFGVPPEA